MKQGESCIKKHPNSNMKCGELKKKHTSSQINKQSIDFCFLSIIFAHSRQQAEQTK
jgi:hypothetical protein